MNLKNLLSQHKQQGTTSFIPMVTELIHANDMINICTDACSICWNKPVPEDYETRCKYIQARIKIGHESVIEHSNVISLLQIPMFESTEDNIRCLLEFLDANDYTKFSSIVKDGVIYILIGGSVRAYKHIFRYIKNPANKILQSIKMMIQENLPKEFFYDFIEDGIMNQNAFTEFVDDPDKKSTHLYDSDNLTIVNMDTISHKWYQRLFEIGFNVRDIYNVLSITILFKNMSRTGTHQLVRHRNAITQESQRYVDYSNACFASPDKFKPDVYDSNKKYDTPSDLGLMTMNEIGEFINTIYSSMLNQGVIKEDARAFLASNTECKKIYITFTMSHFIKFLELRTDKHAQAEIRSYAVEAKDALSISDDELKNLEEIVLKPYYQIDMADNGDYSKIDEVFVSEESDPDSELKKEAEDDVGTVEVSKTDVENISKRLITNENGSNSINKF